MSDLQKYLLVIAAIIGVAVVGRILTDALFPPVFDVFSGIRWFISAVPTWLWWVFFGLAICPLKIALFGRSCRTSRCVPKHSV